ncbi:unnamed protein product, partial [Brenthis ino]
MNWPRISSGEAEEAGTQRRRVDRAAGRQGKQGRQGGSGGRGARLLRRAAAGAAVAREHVRIPSCAAAIPAARVLAYIY